MEPTQGHQKCDSSMGVHRYTRWTGRLSHQIIMHMIRKLGEDKKADWPSHLAEIEHTYNAT